MIDLYETTRQGVPEASVNGNRATCMVSTGSRIVGMFSPRGADKIAEYPFATRVNFGFNGSTRYHRFDDYDAAMNFAISICAAHNQSKDNQ